MIVLIDNYDSFTWNLVQYFGDLGVEAAVHRNNRIAVPEVLALKPAGIVLSPGPSDPDHAGICLPLTLAAAEAGIPLLGVCLGHQTIGQAFGGKIVRAPAPMHGKISKISHISRDLFNNIESPYEVTRYHSLVIEPQSCPPCLEITARTEDGIIMAVQHREKPIHGVQFHPESIATQHGHALLRNFTALL